MCKEMADVFFSLGYTWGPAAEVPEYPTPLDYIFDLQALETKEGGSHNATISRLDPDETDEPSGWIWFNQARFDESMSYSSDGVYMTFEDLMNAHFGAMARSAARLGEPMTQDTDIRGIGDMTLLWNGFGGGKKIKITDLELFLQGHLPDDWTPGPEWCVEELLQNIYNIRYPGTVAPEAVLYLICKNITFGLPTTLCEDRLPFGVPKVHPLNWAGRSYKAAPPNDPFRDIWELAVKYPSDQADLVTCTSNNVEELVAARLGALRAYYFALSVSISHFFNTHAF
jgi:hypothetical protein